MELIALFIPISIVVAILVVVNYHIDPRLKYSYLLPTDDPKWKRIVELHYSNNILTVVTFDHNIKQFYHGINEPNTEVDYPSQYVWKRYLTKRIIRDEQLIRSLDKCYSLVLKGKYIKGEGWVKGL